MRLGAHMSIEGGVAGALRRGAAVGCETIQIFTKNNTRWAGPRPDAAMRAEFGSLRRESGIEPVFAHTSYLINLASANPDVRLRSVDALADEVRRCEELDLPYLVMHPGTHGGAGLDEGIAAVSQGLAAVLAATSAARCRILLETTAGQGTSVGHRFEHLRAILDRVAVHGRLGVCLDTCHVFAAGYELRTPDGYRRTMGEFDRLVGIDNLFALHLNDSRKDLGSHVDRHEHIGQGFLGREAFRHILNDPRLAALPGVLETPKDKECTEDRRNLRILRRLLDRSALGPRRTKPGHN